MGGAHWQTKLLHDLNWGAFVHMQLMQPRSCNYGIYVDVHVYAPSRYATAVQVLNRRAR